MVLLYILYYGVYLHILYGLLHTLFMQNKGFNNNNNNNNNSNNNNNNSNITVYS